MDVRNRLLVKGLLALAVLWTGTFVAIRIVGSLKPTPERIAAFVEDHPLEEISDPGERREVIGRIAGMLNQLEADDIRQIEAGGRGREAQRKLFSTMNEEEQWYFMDLRMGRAFSQMMEVFNEMDRDERKATVRRALERIRSGDGEAGVRGPLDGSDSEMVDKVASAGLQAYFRDASAETKVDLAPLMEEVQKIMSNPGRGGRR